MEGITENAKGKKMPTISLIVPVYDAEEWLPQCLESIKNQTYKDIELIVIDDPDGTGAAAARNRGLDRATGRYVTFCDADDYLEPDAIEKMVEASWDVDLVVGSFRKFGEFDQIVQHDTERFYRGQVAKYALENLRNPRTNQMLSGCWAKLYKRGLQGRFPDLKTAEDMAFNFDYLTRCGEIRFISDVVYHNRKRKGSLSTTFDEKNKPGLFGFLEALKYVKTFLMEFYGEDEVDRAIDNSKVYHSVLYFMRIANQLGLPMRETLMRLFP